MNLKGILGASSGKDGWSPDHFCWTRDMIKKTICRMLSSDHQNVYESILSLQLFFVNLRGALKPYHLWLIKVVINSNRRKLVFSVKHIICCKDTLLRYIIWCHQMSTTYIWGFHLGLWPNLNPLLILSQVDIVLSGRSLCSLSLTVLVLSTVYYTPFLQQFVYNVHSQ